MKRALGGVILILVLCSLLGQAQQTGAASTNAVVPTLVSFSGVLTNSNARPLTSITGVTFSLYAEQEGGAALWLETQNVQADAKGNYTVELGAASADGLPIEVFASGQARWLGVEISGQAEQPRILLLAVPYALKAADAETIGGLPPSAFVRAAAANGGQAKGAGPQEPAAASKTVKTNSPYGTANYLPLWTSASTIQNSNVFQSAAGNVGIGTATPAATLDVNGTGNFSGPITFASGQTFPGTGTITGITTAAGSGLVGGGTSGSLNLSLTNACGANQVLEWSGSAWACASVGTGTITGVTAGTDLTGGGTSGAVTLNVDTTKVPQLAAANTFTGNQTVNGNLSATGVVTGSSYQIGSNLFAFGSYGAGSAFLGFAGSTASQNTLFDTAVGWEALPDDTGGLNTGIGASALYSNTKGGSNTAVGYAALQDDNIGGNNTAVGSGALAYNTSSSFSTAVGQNALGTYNLITGANGSYNVGVGANALSLLTTGAANTGIGYSAGLTADASNLVGNNNTALGTGTQFSTGTLTNATAIGANAVVAESNALVLGSINGVNGQTVSVNVGIGTTTPAAPLDVAAQNLHTYIGGACSQSGYGGITFGTSGFTGCTNYSLLGNGLNTYINAPGGDIFFRINNALGPSAMTITSTKLVGINTDSPDQDLSVNGSADKPGGGSWGTFSDRRLKDLDGSFNSGLNQILKINPVRYRYKDDNGMGIRDHEEHVGVVAQEIQKAIPEAVTENSKGYLLVNNDPVIWAMLNAIKEQQGMIEEQKALIREQQRRIAQLSSQVKAIQASLKTNGRNGSQVRTVRAQEPVHQ